MWVREACQPSNYCCVEGRGGFTSTPHITPGDNLGLGTVYHYRQEDTHFHGSFYLSQQLCPNFPYSNNHITVAVRRYETTFNPTRANISFGVGKKGFQIKKKKKPSLKHLQHSASDPCTSSKIFSTITNVRTTEFIQIRTVPFKIHRLKSFQHTTPSDHHFLPLLPMLTLRLRAKTCNSSRYWPSQRA
jgi:hypothetical protein